MPNAAARLLCVASLFAVQGVAQTDELPQWVLTLSQVKRQAKAEFTKLPNFACVETINRYQARPGTDIYKPLDSLKMDVAFVDGKELVAQDRGGFQELDLEHLATGGVLGTGAFSTIVRNLFVNDNGRVTRWSEEQLDGRRTLRYVFAIPERQAGYTLRSGGGSGTVGIEGSYWVDPETKDLIRLEEFAVDIPPTLDIKENVTSVIYGRVKIGEAQVLLPLSAETMIRNVSGWRAKNHIEFSGCREYKAESIIRFDTDVPTPQKK